MPPPNPTTRAAIQLVAEFARLPVTRTVLEQVELGARRKVGGLWGASVGLLLAAVVPKHKGPLLILTADDVDSLQLQTDLAAFGVASHVLPREEQDDTGEPDPATRSARQRALQRHGSDRAPLIAGIEALLQKVATPKSLSKAQLELHQGQVLDRTQVLQKAQAAGLRSVPLVLAPGECSVRGDVVDLFPMGADSAVRLEFFAVISRGRGGGAVCPVGAKWAAKGRGRARDAGWTRALGCGRMGRMGSGWSGTAA